MRSSNPPISRNRDSMALQIAIRAEAEADGFFRSAVHFDCGDVILDGIARPSAISFAARAAVLFVGPEDHAQRTPRRETQRVNEVRGFERRDAAGTIVLRARADVPGIQMAADDDDFIGPLAAAEFRRSRWPNRHRATCALPCRGARSRVFPESTRRWISRASSMVTAAAGIFGKPSAYSSEPVCGD